MKPNDETFKMEIDDFTIEIFSEDDGDARIAVDLQNFKYYVNDCLEKEELKDMIDTLQRIYDKIEG